jgi:hypothetical protein
MEQINTVPFFLSPHNFRSVLSFDIEQIKFLFVCQNDQCIENVFKILDNFY